MRRAAVITSLLVTALVVVWLALGADDSTTPLATAANDEAQVAPPATAPPALRGGRVAGRVIRDGKPVSRARVTLRAVGPLVTLTLDDGAFLFDDVPSGQIYLSASTTDAASEVMGPLQVTIDSRVDDLVLTLSPSIAVDGRVVDLLTQAPIAKATVITPSQAQVTDAAGHFTVSGAKTQLWLDVSAPGFLTRTEWVSLELAQAGGKLEIVLTPSSWLEGTVTEGGAPIGAATVWAELAEGARRGERTLIAFTDKDGRFTLECAAGSLQLTAVTPRGTKVKGPYVRVAVGERKTGLKLEATDVTSADGTVTLAGQPLAGARISAIDAQTEELSGLATSGPDGRFRFDALALGRYVLQVRADALTVSSGPYEHRGDGASWSVALQPGKTMTGRVVPPGAGTVVRWRSGTWSGPSAQTTTGLDGTFRFEGLPDEQVSVDAEGAQGTASTRARAGQEVVLTLKKSQVIVHLKDDRGAPVTDGVITAKHLETGSTRTQLVLAPDGVARLELSSGRWELLLEVSGRGRSAPAAVTVSDAPVELTLVLAATVTVRGKVTEKTSGLPVNGARVEAFSGDVGKAFRVSVLTDARGEFLLPPVPSNATVFVTRDGLATQWKSAAQGPWDFALEPASPQQQRAPQLSQFEGVGMTLDGRSGSVLVSLVSEGSPAERAGVQVGDQILSVAAVPVAGQTLEQIVQRIRGPAGTPVTITFQRGGQVVELTLRRKLLTL